MPPSSAGCKPFSRLHVGECKARIPAFYRRDRNLLARSARAPSSLHASRCGLPRSMLRRLRRISWPFLRISVILRPCFSSVTAAVDEGDALKARQLTDVVRNWVAQSREWMVLRT